MIELLLNWINQEPRNNFNQFRISDYYELQMEIGFGKGDFLIEQSEKRFDTMFIGFEIKDHCFDILKNKIEQKGILNILIFNCDGIDFIEKQVPENIVNFIHIYFPQYAIDYEGRDIISKKSFSEFDRILKATGQLRLLTDIKKYYKISIENINENSYHLLPWVPMGITNNSVINTEWGHKFNNLKDVFYLNAIKMRKARTANILYK